LDQEEAAELLLGLGEGAIGRRELAAADANGHGSADGLQRLRRDAMAVGLQLLVDRLVLAREGVVLGLAHGAHLLFLVVDQTQVAHWPLLFVFLADLVDSGAAHSTTNRPKRRKARWTSLKSFHATSGSKRARRCWPRRRISPTAATG